MTRTDDWPTKYNPISMYLMSAYSYYVEDDNIIGDWQFDLLAKWLLENIEGLTHPHKHLLTKEDLTAGTYLGEYPLMVKGALNHYRRYELGMTETTGETI
jgi:hypothetical protein